MKGEKMKSRIGRPSCAASALSRVSPWPDSQGSAGGSKPTVFPLRAFPVETGRLLASFFFAGAL